MLGMAGMFLRNAEMSSFEDVFSSNAATLAEFLATTSYTNTRKDEGI